MPQLTKGTLLLLCGIIQSPVSSAQASSNGTGWNATRIAASSLPLGTISRSGSIPSSSVFSGSESTGSNSTSNMTSIEELYLDTSADLRIEQDKGTINDTNPVVSLLRGSACYGNSSSWSSKYYTEMTSFTETNPFLNLYEGASNIPWMPGVQTYAHNPSTNNPFYCCGSCHIYWNGVKVFYWPKYGANTECLTNQATTGILMKNLPDLMNDDSFWHPRLLPIDQDGGQTMDVGPPVGGGLGRRQASVSAGVTSAAHYNSSSFDGTVIKNGSTYVSPSIYIEIPKFYAQDNCWTTGPSISNFRTSFHPNDVSSVAVNDIRCWGNYLEAANNPQTMDHLPQNCTYEAQSLNWKDLPCPPQSLRDRYNNQFLYNPRQEYLPILAIEKLKSAVPEWSSCSLLYGWDPYSALQPFGDVLPPATKANDPPAPTSGPGKPAHTTAGAWKPSPAPGMTVSSDDPKETPKPSKPAPVEQPDPSDLQDPTSPKPGDPDSSSTDPAPTPVANPHQTIASKPTANNNDQPDTNSPDNTSNNQDNPESDSFPASNQDPNRDSPQQISGTSEGSPQQSAARPAHGTGNEDPSQQDPSPDSSLSHSNEHSSPEDIPAVNQPNPTLKPITTLGHTISFDGSNPMVGGTTVKADTPITVDNTPIRLVNQQHPSSSPKVPGIVIGHSTLDLPSPPVPSQAAPITTLDRTISFEGSKPVIDGTSLQPNAPITIDSTPIRLVPQASDDNAPPSILVGDSTIPLPALVTPTPSAITTLGQTIFLDGTNTVVDGSTLQPGVAVTINATPIKIAPQASDSPETGSPGRAIIIGTNTVDIPTAGPSAGAAPAQIITAGHTIVPPASPSNDAIIDGTSLTPGQIVTATKGGDSNSGGNGQMISFASNGQSIVFGSGTAAETVTLLPITSLVGGVTTGTSGSQTAEIDAQPTGLVISGSTIDEGQALTMGGTIISLQSDGDAVIGSKTVDLKGHETGIGGLIWTVLGQGNANGGGNSAGSDGEDGDGNAGNTMKNGTSSEGGDSGDNVAAASGVGKSLIRLPLRIGASIGLICWMGMV